MARYDDPQFIIDQGLDPGQWHVVGQPAVGIDPNTGRPSTQPRSEQQDFTITIAGPGGQNRVVTMRPQGPGVSAGNVGLNQLDWNVTKVEQGITPTDTGQTGGVTPQNANDKARAETAAATAQAAAAAQQLKDLQDENNKKQGNLTTRGLFMTDDQIAAMDKSLRDQGLQQQQIDAQLKIASDNNLNARTANETAAVNAATSAKVAESNAKIAEARLALDGTAEADKKAQDVWTQEHATITDAQAQQKIDLDRLSAQQANQISQAQVASTQEANRIRGVEATETGRHNVATETAQSQATQTQAISAAQQTAANAAASVYGNELQAKTAAGTVGENLLANRVTGANNLINNILSGAGNMSQGSAGRYGTLGGGLHALPAGFSGADLVGGAYGVVGDAMGGQDTLNAAAAMVRNAAPGSELTPMGQAAIGVLHQAFDRVKQLSGAVAAPATAAAPGAGAPTTVGTAAVAQPGAVPAPITIAPQNAVAGQNYGASTAYTGGVAPWNAQPGPAIPMFAPVTVTA